MQSIYEHMIQGTVMLIMFLIRTKNFIPINLDQEKSVGLIFAICNAYRNEDQVG